MLTRKQSIWGKISLVALGALLILLPFAGCAPEAPEETLAYADGGWDSIQVHSRIVAFVLEHGYGYQAEFIPGETITLLQGVLRGDLDIHMEVWIKSQQEAYDKAIATGNIVNLGTNFADTWQGWVVPTYMIKGDPARGIEPMAPDLKSVSDMPKYWELFKDPEVPTKGRFHSCIPGWECQVWNEMKIESYGLDEYYNLFLPGSGPALAGSMAAAYEKGEPWFGYYWEPTWIMGKFDMTKVEEPPFDEEIWETTKACAWPSDPTEIVVHVSLLDRAPEVVEFLKKYETTTAMNNEFLAYMQETEADTQAAAIWFLKEYESLWTQWVPSSVAKKVKAALETLP